MDWINYTGLGLLGLKKLGLRSKGLYNQWVKPCRLKWVYWVRLIMDFGLHVGSYRAQKKKKKRSWTWFCWVELNWAWFFNGVLAHLVWYGFEWHKMGLSWDGEAWILGLVSDLQIWWLSGGAVMYGLYVSRSVSVCAWVFNFYEHSVWQVCVNTKIRRGFSLIFLFLFLFSLNRNLFKLNLNVYVCEALYCRFKSRLLPLTPQKLIFMISHSTKRD